MRTLIMAMLLAAAGTTEAQTHGGLHHGAGAQPGHQEAQQCARSFDRVISEGLGFGLAFPADQNGYPWPVHVLELGEALKLSAKQEAHVRTLRDAMFAESRPKSAALLDAESRLRRLFENRTATEPAVRAQVTEVERLRSEVRLIHLLYHLKTRDLLTEPQRAIYHEKRWTSGG